MEEFVGHFQKRKGAALLEYKKAIKGKKLLTEGFKTVVYIP